MRQTSAQRRVRREVRSFNERGKVLFVFSPRPRPEWPLAEGVASAIVRQHPKGFRQAGDDELPVLMIDPRAVNEHKGIAAAPTKYA